MRTNLGVGIVVAATLAAFPLAAQTAAPQPDQKQSDQQRRDAEKQMRDAEKQMRDAERQMREAEQAMRDAGRKLGDAAHQRLKLERKVVMFGDHARLGIVLRHEKDPRTDSVGAVVEALTPGSPAEEAGLQAGDIVTTFDGKALAGGPVEGDDEESGPTLRLLELGKALTDGQKVVLGFRRGAAAKTVTVTARREAGSRMKVISGAPYEIPDMGDIEIPDIPDFDVDVMIGRHWRDIELVALDPELGAYFGTSAGLLVVHTPKDDALKLKAGDVILKIGERTPDTPSKAMRILRSYEPGETVPVQVLRKHEKLTVSAVIPQDGGGHARRAPRAPEAPPAPAAPPAPHASSTNL